MINKIKTKTKMKKIDHGKWYREYACGDAPQFDQDMVCRQVNNTFETIEVVGEYYVENNVYKAFELAGKEYAWAILRTERDNPVDKNAVMVVINGLKVGYLDAELASLIQPLLASYEDIYQVRVTCPAQFYDNPKNHFNKTKQVRLFINPWELKEPKVCDFSNASNMSKRCWFYVGISILIVLLIIFMIGELF